MKAGLSIPSVFVAGLAVCSASAQLIPVGSPLPHTSKPPVVFINGFQTFCPVVFADTFGMADQVLKNNGEASVFFNTCNLGLTASIEELGASFGEFLAGLRYDDAQPVDLVDVVAHSMGGLVLRSYLSGKQNAAGVFQPPQATHVRKVVFLATPHFGTGVAVMLGGALQLQELASGSRFLFDLATWNQGTDDLRGVDAIAAIGNGGSGLATMPGFDDGLVALTSGSVRFYQSGRSRVVPFCHVTGGGLVSLFGLCSPSAQGIANIGAATHDSARIIMSFFNGNDEWKTVGKAVEDDPFLSVNGGVIVSARTADDSDVKLNSATAGKLGSTKALNIPSSGVAYTDLLASGPITLTGVSGSLTVSASLTLPATGTQAYSLKPGPSISRVIPAAASLFPLSVAPGMFVAIYGAALASQTAQASTNPFPLQLADVQVLLNGLPVPLYFVSAGQIDAVIPDGVSGLVKLTVRNTAGSHTVNVFVESAVPAIFTQNASGTGEASALNAVTNRLVTAADPLHAGDFVALFATGLGSTTLRNSLAVADRQPAVTIGGKDCAVTFAGRAPGYVGLDQINCMVPAGIAATPSAPVVITSGNRVSNVATLAIE